MAVNIKELNKKYEDLNKINEFLNFVIIKERERDEPPTRAAE
ncbi:hypothetical protein [endosymbiont DhMRE of Dentiscutata heterogama]|nr:hypothetical protein [endosymbiont DhMRE of Dentiscutata heterogama]